MARTEKNVVTGLAKRRAFVRRRTLEIVRANPRIKIEALKKILAAEKIGNWAINGAYRDAVAKVAGEKVRASLAAPPRVGDGEQCSDAVGNNGGFAQRLVDLEWEVDLLKAKVKKIIIGRLRGDM